MRFPIRLTSLRFPNSFLEYHTECVGEALHTASEHLHDINRVRLELERRHPNYRWVSERVLRATQPRREERSVVPHLPDALAWEPKPIAVEVERSPKSPKELDDLLTELLITGAATADGEPPLLYTTVWYFVTTKTRSSVELARDHLPADLQPRVKVLSLETSAPR